MAMGDLRGATVLVTGGAGGIGKALADGFRNDGASVVAIDVNAGPDITVADVADPAAVAELVARYDRIDVLVNNAGIGIEGRIEDCPPGQYERVLAVNLFGPFYMLRAVLPLMRRQNYGRVIN